MATKSRLPEWAKKYENEILQNWIKEQIAAAIFRTDLLPEAELRRQSKDFLNAFNLALQGEELTDITGPHWENVRAMLGDISNSRVKHGFTPSETITFVSTIKKPFHVHVDKELGNDAMTIASEMFLLIELLEKLGLYLAEMYIKNKEEIIRRQQDDMLELSTPVVKVWDQIIAIPLIGTLDSGRAQVVTENLLQEIVKTSSGIVIIDITGVPTVDTLVAQHLIKTVAAARLMGAECIISGIRPQIAQTMVHLGVTWADIVTKATLADAIKYAFAKLGLRMTSAEVMV